MADEGLAFIDARHCGHPLCQQIAAEAGGAQQAARQGKELRPSGTQGVTRFRRQVSGIDVLLLQPPFQLGKGEHCGDVPRKLGLFGLCFLGDTRPDEYHFHLGAAAAVQEPGMGYHRRDNRHQEPDSLWVVLFNEVYHSRAGAGDPRFQLGVGILPQILDMGCSYCICPNGSLGHIGESQPAQSSHQTSWVGHIECTDIRGGDAYRYRLSLSQHSLNSRQIISDLFGLPGTDADAAAI